MDYFYPGVKQITNKPKSSSSNLFHLCLHFVLVLATEYSLSTPAVIQCHSLDNWPIFQLKMRDVRCCHCKHWTWVKRGSKVGQPRSVQWSKELPRSRKGCHVYWAWDDWKSRKRSCQTFKERKEGWGKSGTASFTVGSEFPALIHIQQKLLGRGWGVLKYIQCASAHSPQPLSTKAANLL